MKTKRKRTKKVKPEKVKFNSEKVRIYDKSTGRWTLK